MYKCMQKAALAVGLPLLLFLGLRASDDGNEAAFRRDAALAFALLTLILMGAAVALWYDSGRVWPGLLAAVFLALLGSGLFRLTRPAATATDAPRRANGRP